MTYSVGSLRAYDRGKSVKGLAVSPRYLEQVPHCWMCNGTLGHPTREHLFGQWTDKHFSEEQRTFEPHRDKFGAGLIIGEKRGPMPSKAVVSGGVCNICNNGWMSSLEAQVEHIIFSKDRILNDAKAMVLTQWLAKTSVIINVSQTSPLKWPATDRHRLQSGVPAGVRVNIFRLDDSDLNWLQGETLAMTVPGAWTSIAPALSGITHTCRIRIHNIVGVIVRFPWQIAHAEFAAPGEVLWDGKHCWPLDLDELPILEDWRDGLVTASVQESSFLAAPPIDFFIP